MKYLVLAILVWSGKATTDDNDRAEHVARQFLKSVPSSDSPAESAKETLKKINFESYA
jgi:hypothetical protein